MQAFEWIFCPQVILYNYSWLFTKLLLETWTLLCKSNDPLVSQILRFACIVPFISLVCSSVLHTSWYYPFFTISSELMLCCSTVDQFSGESKPITLPLDENQVCSCFITCGGFKMFGHMVYAYLLAYSWLNCHIILPLNTSTQDVVKIEDHVLHQKENTKKGKIQQGVLLQISDNYWSTIRW